MKFISARFAVATISSIGLLAANALAQDTSAAGGPSPAATYCLQSGGVVESRVPFYGTNGPPSSWLRLAGERQFCQFTSATDGSRIHILMDSLYATKPTLAVLAYDAKVPYKSGGGGNPASYYCSQLGGSDLFGGVNAAGGGWFYKPSVDQVLEACIFPDMSSIDSWGLLYHSVGIIRGIDLTTVQRFHKP